MAKQITFEVTIDLEPEAKGVPTALLIENAVTAVMEKSTNFKRQGKTHFNVEATETNRV